MYSIYLFFSIFPVVIKYLYTYSAGENTMTMFYLVQVFKKVALKTNVDDHNDFI